MRRIDAFAHILPQRTLAELERLLARPDVSERVRGYGAWFHEDPSLHDLEARWRSLEGLDDYSQILLLSVPPVAELGEPVRTRELARLANDELAELVASYPDRFAGFGASLPLNDVDASLEEMERAVLDLGALGIQLHTNVCGHPLDSPELEPVFARAEQLEAAIWLHPTRSAVWADYPSEPQSRYDIFWSLGWPYETAAAMARLVYSGRLERHPGLVIVAHHGGGLVSHLSGRLAVVPAGDGAEQVRALPREPLDYFRMFYVDTALFGAPHAVECAIEFFGADHVLFGTDTPLGGRDSDTATRGTAVIADTIADLESLGLSEDDRHLVYHNNAERLFPGVWRDRARGRATSAPHL